MSRQQTESYTEQEKKERNAAGIRKDRPSWGPALARGEGAADPGRGDGEEMTMPARGDELGEGTALGAAGTGRVAAGVFAWSGGTGAVGASGAAAPPLACAGEARGRGAERGTDAKHELTVTCDRNEEKKGQQKMT